MKHRRKRNTSIAWLILLFSICGMIFFGYRLWDTQQTYRKGNQSYEQLAARVRPDGSSLIHTPETSKEPLEANAPLEIDAPAAPVIEIPDMSIDFTTLRAINTDAAGWLYSPGTVIDYPVMQATDYDYYLRHLPDGTYNANGTLFIDYNCAPDFGDNLTIIYGHHMKSGRMFGSIVGYKRQAYFDEHPYMYLYTEHGNYRIDLMYGCVIGAGKWRERAFMYKENLDALLDYAAYNTTFESDVQYHEGEKIIVLSTCSYEFNSARYIVIGVLRPEYADD